MKFKTMVAVGLAVSTAAGIGTCMASRSTPVSSERSQSSSAENERGPLKEVREFSTEYVEARERFFRAARAASGKIESFRNPHVGPEGSLLFTDVALLGSNDATAVVVLGSGTHGVEGFAGSAIQTGLLREGFASRLPHHVAVVAIHAINPYGMAHLRRVNEDNVDLNRNFRDHSQPYERNAGYERLADAIAPRSLSFWAEVGSRSRLLWFRATAGSRALQDAVTGGQYSHPKGLFYGGTFETWSNRTLRSIAERYLSHADRVVLVDFHTGLGDFGSAEIILNEPADAPAVRRATAIWGADRVRSTAGGESLSIHIGASVKLAFPRMLPDAEVTAVSLEFGTIPGPQVVEALRAENWLHHHGGPGHPRAREIKARLLRAFHPASPEWEARVWKQGKEVAKQALDWVGRPEEAE